MQGFFVKQDLRGIISGKSKGGQANLFLFANPKSSNSWAHCKSANIYGVPVLQSANLRFFFNPKIANPQRATFAEGPLIR